LLTGSFSIAAMVTAMTSSWQRRVALLATKLLGARQELLADV
jgi:hypothetical protein